MISTNQTYATADLRRSSSQKDRISSMSLRALWFCCIVAGILLLPAIGLSAQEQKESGANAVIQGTGGSSACFTHSVSGRTVSVNGWCSTNVVAFHFTWGDGHESNSAMASHTYANSGQRTFTVCLNVTPYVTTCKNITVAASPPTAAPPTHTPLPTNTPTSTSTATPTATPTHTPTSQPQGNPCFTFSPGILYVNQPVTFDASCSLYANLFHWTFSDGGTGTGPSVQHTFSTAGTHRACLVINGTFTLCKQLSVVDPLPINADFHYQLTDPVERPTVGYPIMFFDHSDGEITSWTWSFGPGSRPAHARGKGPHSVTYSQDGLKTIILTVQGPTSDDTVSKQITVATKPPTAKMTISPKEGQAYKTEFQFANTSIVPGELKEIQWNFGDSSEISNEEKPTHIYRRTIDGPTKYNVWLTVIDTYDQEATVSQTVFVDIPPPPRVTALGITDFDNIRREVSFRIDAQTFGPLKSIEWDFGDGSTPQLCSGTGMTKCFETTHRYEDPDPWEYPDKYQVKATLCDYLNQCDYATVRVTLIPPSDPETYECTQEFITDQEGDEQSKIREMLQLLQQGAFGSAWPQYTPSVTLTVIDNGFPPTDEDATWTNEVTGVATPFEFEIVTRHEPTYISQNPNDFEAVISLTAKWTYNLELTAEIVRQLKATLGEGLFKQLGSIAADLGFTISAGFTIHVANFQTARCSGSVSDGTWKLTRKRAMTQKELDLYLKGLPITGDPIESSKPPKSDIIPSSPNAQSASIADGATVDESERVEQPSTNAIYLPVVSR